MADEDRRRWDARYESAPEVEPAPPERFSDFVDAVPHRGLALDIACGLGAQSLWAARRGLHVHAVDISATAVERLVAAAARLGLADRIEAWSADLDAGLPAAASGPYDLIVMQRFRAPHLLEAVPRLLAPEGLAVISVLSRVGLAAEPGPFHAAPGELMAAFGVDGVDGVEIRSSVEADGLATVVVARR